MYCNRGNHGKYIILNVNVSICILCAAVFTNGSKSEYVYTESVCIFVYLCKCLRLYWCNGKMSGLCMCLITLPQFLSPPITPCWTIISNSLSHVYTASHPLFHLLFVLLLHTSSSIKLSPLSCAEQEEGALPRYSNILLHNFRPMLMIVPILIVSYISQCIPDPPAA